MKKRKWDITYYNASGTIIEEATKVSSLEPLTFAAGCSQHKRDIGATAYYMRPAEGKAGTSLVIED